MRVLDHQLNQIFGPKKVSTTLKI